MKDDGRPETNANKAGGEACSKKNQNNGDIVKQEAHNQASGSWPMTIFPRQPAGDSDGQQGDSCNASDGDGGRLGELRTDQNRDHQRRSSQ